MASSGSSNNNDSKFLGDNQKIYTSEFKRNAINNRNSINTITSSSSGLSSSNFSDSKATYAKSGIQVGEYNSSIIHPPTILRATKNIDDNTMHSVGLYSKSEIEKYRFNYFSRAGRIIDPFGHVNNGFEYLFFVKPDLHIVIPQNRDNKVYSISYGSSSPHTSTYTGLTMNPQLDNNGYFQYLIDTHPEVVKSLQISASNSSKNPFCNLLSSSVSSNLGLPSSDSSTLETVNNSFGTNLEYLNNSIASDENLSFSLEFVDNKYLDTYNFFRAYTEYHQARRSGLVTPPNSDYYRFKRTHNTMAIYKFIVAEDMETLLYWGWYCGVFPTNCPRDGAFSDPNFSGEGLTFSVDFKAAFYDDMKLEILWNFYSLMKIIATNKGININSYASALPVYDSSTGLVNRTLPCCANVFVPQLSSGSRVSETSGNRLEYKLKWFSDRSAMT